MTAVKETELKDKEEKESDVYLCIKLTTSFAADEVEGGHITR